MAKKRYRVELAPAADRQRRKLSVDVQKRIVRALEQLETDPRPPGVRKLQGEDDLWRLRVGDYRVIYTIEDDQLLVLVVRVANRRDAYGK
jgi:mRNA interferase RelE/StbE